MSRCMSLRALSQEPICNPTISGSLYGYLPSRRGDIDKADGESCPTPVIPSINLVLLSVLYILEIFREPEG